jgi:MFS family permease
MPEGAQTPRLEREGAFSWRFVSPLLVGSMMNPINTSLIATALVPIAHGIHVSVGRTAVIVSALYLACAISQPTAGKLGEEFGPRRVFLGGILTMLIGGVVGGLGRDLMTLVVSRALIGVGTATGYPSAMLIIRRRAEAVGLVEPPGAVLGALVIAATATISVGLPLGGVLVGVWGWRTTFLINIPFALGALAIALRWIPKDPPVGPTTIREVSGRIDLPGIIGFGMALAALLVFLMSLPHPDWVAFAVGLLVTVALVLWELRAVRPFFDVRLLATDLALTRTYIRFGLVALVVYAVLYGLSQWLEAGRNVSAEEAGLLVVPMCIVSAVVVGPMSARNLVRLPLIVAAVSSLAGSAGLLLLTNASPIIWIIVITLIFGVTLGTTASGNQTTLYSQAAASQIGTASGLLRTFGFIGSIVSTAIIGVAFRVRVSVHGLHTIAVALIVVSVAAILVTVCDRSLMRQARIQRKHPPLSPSKDDGADTTPETASLSD